MSVPEICVQIKNVPGQLVRVTTVLADSGLSILGMTALATGKVGWVRVIVDNSKFALEALDDYGFTVELGEAVAVQLGDEAGSIDRALRILSDEKINVDYIYNIWERDAPEAVTVLGVQSPSKVEKLLKAEGFEVVDIKA
ncbi:hypothetical protein CVU37_00135 [candidate division BRC1 bacterium HGW-BRC1-1]|jgi:hypothetical protein|nr:MAG: hypothetical protein CVU37_00135 [candidate division BRC1 bacterium HGW-BRC1-1]